MEKLETVASQVIKEQMDILLTQLMITTIIVNIMFAYHRLKS